MALVWLYAARYADTNGYSIDGGRHMWLWCDWVINAFNTNLPYDQFVRDQLAGDLIPNHTEAQLVATGFQAQQHEHARRWHHPRKRTSPTTTSTA